MPSINVGAGSMVFGKYPKANNYSDIYIRTAAGFVIPLTDGINQNPAYDNFDADWSPTGDFIIFSTLRDDPVQKHNTEIYTMELADPTNLQRITTAQWFDESPHWSGTANMIVFTSNRHNNGKVQIYKMSPNGTNVVRLTDNAYEDLHPRWSPNGMKIAFEREITREESQIFVMDADGTNELNLTDSTAISSEPDWSPDGSKLVFASDLHNPQSGHFEIYTMDPADTDGDGMGDNLQRVTNMNSNILNTAPHWSPDGTKIIFVSNSLGTNDAQLYTVAPNGSNLTQVTADPLSNYTGARYLP